MPSDCQGTGHPLGCRPRMTVWRIPFFARCSPLLLGLAAAAPARGQPSAGEPETKRACAAQYEQAQVLRNSGNLLDALSSLLSCSHQACQAAVRGDCVQWYQEVKQSIPSVVLSARAEAGDIVDVRASVDGKLVSTRLDGRPIELNPGSHSFRLESPGFEPVERQVLLVPGEKLRSISVTLVPSISTAPASPEAPAPAEQPALPAVEAAAERPDPDPIPTLTYVALATTAAGAVGFAAFGLWGLSERDSLAEDCQPACNSSDVDAVRTKLLIADASLGLSVISAVAAGVIYFTRPTREVELAPAAGPSAGAYWEPGLSFTKGSGAVVGIRGAF